MPKRQPHPNRPPVPIEQLDVLPVTVPSVAAQAISELTCYNMHMPQWRDRTLWHCSKKHPGRYEVLRARDATGLEIPSVACGPHSRMLAQPNPSARQAGVDGIQQALRDAKRYGASSILVVPGLVNESISYAENWQRTQAGIRACIPLAEELGVKMAIENVHNNFLPSPMEAARYVDEFQSATVGFHLDIGNLM